MNPNDEDDASAPGDTLPPAATNDGAREPDVTRGEGIALSVMAAVILACAITACVLGLLASGNGG